MGVWRPRVLVVDADEPAREAIRGLLEADGWHVVGEAPSADRLDGLPGSADVCLLDISGPGNGPAAVRAIAAAHPDTAVVVLTASADSRSLFESLRAGARGYLLKDMNPARLGPALRGVLDGEAAIPRELVARVLEEFRKPRDGSVQARRTDPLTSREREILELLRAGLTTAQVAAQLFISQGTVRVHVSGALKKLGVADREAALRLLDGQ